MRNESPEISQVVKADLCLQCGTCASICPENCIVIKRDSRHNYVPSVNQQQCSLCGLCIKVCPGLEVDFRDLSRALPSGGNAKQHPYLGTYCSTYLGYSTSKQIRSDASSGGIVPTLLSYLLQTGQADGVITVRSIAGQPFSPEVFIAKTHEDILSSIQSKYHPVCLNTALQSLDSHGDGKLVFVGLPCHIHGLRKFLKLKKLEQKLLLTIGLFCGLNLRFDSLEYFSRQAGQDIKNLDKALYREGPWPGKTVLRFDGSFSYTADRNLVNHIYTLPRCLLCIDHTSELADISCGDAWLSDLIAKHDDGWSAIIARSSKGEAILGELSKNNMLFLEKVDSCRIIESQYPMLCFKKRNSWLRLNLHKMFWKKTPQYKTDLLTKDVTFCFIAGNLILLGIISLMKIDKIKHLINRTPLGILKFYKLLVINLLYKDKHSVRVFRKLFPEPKRCSPVL